MAKYKIILHYYDGTEEEQDEEFDDLDDAQDYGNYLIGCCREGAEVLNLSNPGDYPLGGYEDPEVEIIEVDE